MVQVTVTQGQTSETKQAYQQPRLVRYGSFSDLTQKPVGAIDAAHS